jgi:hypothetical protein
MVWDWTEFVQDIQNILGSIQESNLLVMPISKCHATRFVPHQLLTFSLCCGHKSINIVRLEFWPRLLHGSMLTWQLVTSGKDWCNY